MSKAPEYRFGWYLQEADKAITDYIAKELEKHELTRFHWQILNRIHLDGFAIKEKLYVTRYINSSELDDILDSLLQREWIKINKKNHATEIRLTEKGQAAFPTVSNLIKQAHQKIFQAINKEDYEVTIKVLTRLINTLE